MAALPTRALQVFDAAERILQHTDHWIAFGNIESARGRIIRRQGDYVQSLHPSRRSLREEKRTPPGFIVDLELNARRALNPEELKYFLDFYRDNDGQLDEVPRNRAKLDEAVRMKFGKRALFVGLWPIEHYMQATDTRPNP